MPHTPPLPELPSPAAPARPTGRGMHIVVGLAVVCLNAWILIHFHDQFWWAPDEGNYAHVAERILDGEVLHAEVQDIHPGYVNFTNAGAMGLFGRRMVSMRYPLVALGIVQCGVIFALLSPLGLLAASVGATTITALGFVQYLDPTAHWYALFFALALAGVLQYTRPTHRWRLDVIGALIMTAALFRQLSGVFIAMGALTFLLLEPSRDSTGAASREDDGPPWLARTLVAVMLAGLVGYLVRATEEVGWLLFGVWPVLLLLWTGWATRTPNGAVVTMIARLGRGGAVAALPLVAYHLSHGSFGAWYRDVVVTATQFPRMPFFDTMNYGAHAAGAVGSIVVGGAQGIVNGLFWIVLTLLAAIVGALLLRQHAAGRMGGPGPAALPIMAVFYAVVSVHYQIPIYLTYTVGFSAIALLSLTNGSRAAVVTAVALSIIGLYYHAGQPLSRGLDGTSDGVRTAGLAESTLWRAGLRVEPTDVALYDSVVTFIRAETPAGSTIFAVPSHAELYFLAERRNPFPFFNTALGIRTPGDLQRVLATIDRDPPVLVVHNPEDKYNTPESLAIMERVTATYEKLPSIRQFEIYRRRDTAVAAGMAAPSSRE